MSLKVQTPNAKISDNHVYAEYNYELPVVEQDAQTGSVKLKSLNTKYELRTKLSVPKLGVMLVGWGGNNGSTLTASIIANKDKLSWKTKRGAQSANYFGSVFMSSTTKVGVDAKTGQDVFLPLNQILPMVNPNDIVIGGWDISSLNLAEAMVRAQVLEPDLQAKVYDQMKQLKPLPSIYYPDFIAANQEDRADNVIKSDKKQEHLDQLRADIRNFKQANKLDQVIVLWTANTERFAELITGVNDNSENLMRAIQNSHEEVSPSTMFAVASILEKCPFINGSPQNTFVPGVLDLAAKSNVYIGGDDFKSGQTKLKSVLVDFLVGAGIKPIAIASCVAAVRPPSWAASSCPLAIDPTCIFWFLLH